MSFIEYRFKVRWGDTDAAGIVFYPNFYKWMDEASHHFFSELGYPTAKLFAEEKIGLPILEATCQFHSPLLFDDEVCIRSSIAEMRDKIFTIEHEFFKEEIKVASGYEKRAWANFSNGRPKAVPIPAAVREALSSGQNWESR